MNIGSVIAIAIAVATAIAIAVWLIVFDGLNGKKKKND